MIRAFLITILLFACKQTVNKDVPAMDHEATTSANVGDTLATKAKSPDGDNSPVPLQEEKIRITFDTTLFNAALYPDYEFESTIDSIYTLITFMTEGPPSPPGDDYEGGSYHRLVITTSGIQNRIYIESGDMNLNGKNRSIGSRRLIDDAEFVKKFATQGGFRGVKFVDWRDWDSFVVEIDGIEYIFKDIGNNPVTVQVKNRNPGQN